MGTRSGKSGETPDRPGPRRTRRGGSPIRAAGHRKGGRLSGRPTPPDLVARGPGNDFAAGRCRLRRSGRWRCQSTGVPPRRVRPGSGRAVDPRDGHRRDRTSPLAAYGSVGSCTEPPRLSFTCARVSSFTMACASATDRASRSSFVTTRVSPARHAARTSRGRPPTRPHGPANAFPDRLPTPPAEHVDDGDVLW